MGKPDIGRLGGVERMQLVVYPSHPHTLVFVNRPTINIMQPGRGLGLPGRVPVFSN